MRHAHLRLVAAAAVTLAASIASAEPVTLDPVQVTATRLPESVNVVPANITVVRGDELRARGASDLRTALSLVAGVEISPGGDSGPAGSIPAFYGLREFDAFLLVVDGVPAGGAFNPTLNTLDLHNVKQIEVLRGAAPVMYGATSFVGVIHIIHYPAGESENLVTLSVGDPQSVGATVSTVLSKGALNQSITADARRDRFSDDRAAVNRGHLAYRMAQALSGGTLHVDGEVTEQHQIPAGLTLRENFGTASPQRRRPTPKTPVDANHNPSDAHINDSRQHLVVGFDRATELGQFGTTFALTHTDTAYLRGFLLNTTAPQSSLPASDNAAGFDQSRDVWDSYFDAHLVKDFGPVNLTYGLDWLHGSADVQSRNFSYKVSLDGRAVQSSRDGPATFTPPDLLGNYYLARDTRDFFGAYAQCDWNVLPGLDVTAGVRFNNTHEKLESTADTTAGRETGRDSLTKIRGSGTLGLSWAAYQQGGNTVIAYTDYRNSFKPAAFDFGPRAEPDAQVNKAETARAYEAGFKGALLGGDLRYDLSSFYVNFDNFFVPGNDGTKVRLNGFELESRYKLMKDVQLAANYAYHETRFVQIDSPPVSGNHPEFSPHVVAGLGLMLLPADGFNAALIGSYTGHRFIDKRNRGEVPSYTVLDAHFGYHFAQGYGVALDGTNLTDRHDTVSESEYSDAEFGAPAYTRLQGRRVLLTLSKTL